MATLTRLSGRALALLLPDLNQAPGPRYAALANGVIALLLDGRVAPGTTLPSERELAAALSLSRSTVTAAYDALRGECVLVSRIGSGSVTTLPAHPAGGTPSLVRPLDAPRFASRRTAGAAAWPGWSASAAGGPPWDRQLDDGGHDLIDMSCAVFPAPPQFPAAAARAIDRLPEYTRGSGYEPTGIPALRQVIADRFAARGVPTVASEIMVTNGALHGIDVVLRLLVAPGDRVLTELPTYSGLLDAVRASGARALAVPVDPQGGWQLPSMVAALRQNSPRLAILVPDFHNPTGFLVPAADRTEILRAARRSGTAVLVDESGVDIGFVDPAIPCAALDPAVITVGSLSKPVWGGLRVGWIRASTETIQRLAVVRAAADMGQSILEQLVALELFAELGTIVDDRVRQVKPRRDHLVAELGRQLPHWRTPIPDGGLSLWVELDAALATPLAVRAAQYGVRIVAGSRFGVDGTMERFLRLPYALPEPTLSRVVGRLAAAWREIDAKAGGYSPLIVA